MSQVASERDLKVTITNIHALACNLLNVDERTNAIYVGVMPESSGWNVRVRYESFSMLHRAPTLEDALEQTLRDLMSRVMSRLEGAEQLIASLKVKSTE